MALPDRYRRLLESPRQPSPLFVLLPEGDEPPTATAAIAALSERFGAAFAFDMVVPPTEPDAAWEATCRVGERGFQVFARRSPDTDLLQQVQPDAEIFGPEAQTAIAASRWCVGAKLVLGADPTEDLHFQLAVLAALAPRGLALLDVVALRLHHMVWLRESAASSAPPSPAALYTIHSVGEGDAPRWLHTHGLLRCGMVEIEMFDVPAGDSGALGHLLNVVAAMFLEHGLPPPGTPVAAGAGIDVVWLPWEKALAVRPPRTQGGREDRDDPHSVPSAVLFARAPKLLGLFGSGLAPIARLAARLDDSPVLFVSTAETRRMELLARERLPLLRALFAELQGNESFVFVVKLGFETAGGDDGAREHLWFEVHGFRGDLVDATCTNAPMAVPTLREGQRGEHELARLSDWSIFCPVGRFDAERVHLLQHFLANAPAEARRSLGLPDREAGDAARGS